MTKNTYRPTAFLALFAVAVLAAGLLAVVGAKPAWAAEPSFAPAQNFPVGTTPTTVTNADFNSDGKMDLAAQNSSSNTVSVLLGKGDGTFQAKQDSGVGSGPTAVTSTDFNGDTKADLAVANWYSNNVSVLLGKGDGTFQTKQDFGAGGRPSSVISAHLNDDNADGKVDSADVVDLAVANFTSDTVSVLFGNGDGTFKTPQNISIRPPCPTTGVVILPDCPPGVWFEGTYMRNPVVAGPNQVISADFNRDGRTDLATTSIGDYEPDAFSWGLRWIFIPGGVSVLLSKPDGTFQEAKLVKRNSTNYSLTTGDFNGDIKPDLVATEYTSNVVSMLLGNGDGTFSTGQNLPVGTNPSAVTSANFNSDAMADLAVSNYTSDNVSVLFSNSNGSFQAAQNFPAGDGPAFVIGADLGAHSYADLAVANQDSNNVSVLLNTLPAQQTTITSGPSGSVNSTSATFEFSSSGLGSTFQCALDNPSAYSSCASPQTYSGLSEGSHTFYVKAASAAGNTDPLPATRTWTVDTTAPNVGIVSPADATAGAALSTNVEGTFSEAMNKASVEAPDTFTLNERGFPPIAATVTYDSATKKATLDPGSDLTWNTTYVATIKGGSSGAKDTAGNPLGQDYIWTFSTANDTTAPSTTHTLSPQPNAAGWNNGNIKLSLSATDNASGIKEISYSINGSPTTVQQSSVQIPITGEGETTISYHATDKAGNVESEHTFTVKLDKTAPQITPGDDVSDVWRKSPLSAEFTASDSGSGLANSADATFTLTASQESASANQPTIASRTVFDAAGNSTTRKVSALIDVTSPRVTASLAPQPNAAGWNREDVTVTLSATDNASGVKEISYSIDGGDPIPVNQSSVNIPVANEGETTISYAARDDAGNTASQGATTVKLDNSAPTSTATATDSASNNYTSGTWTNKDVTVELSANDGSGSGVGQISYSVNGSAARMYNSTDKIIVNSEGISTISYFATDNAGNQESPAQTFTVKIDKSAPTLDIDDSDGTDGITPDRGQTGVRRDIEPKATFSDEMELASLRTSAKLYQWNALEKVWQQVPARVSVVGKTAKLNPYPSDPTRLLAANTKFKITITTGAKNLAEIPLSSPQSWTFTTGSR